jgi:transcriptional antiterminator NusG
MTIDEQDAPNEQENANPNLKWYVVNTYSGLENRAKKALEERIIQYHLQDKFGEIFVPTETVEEIKGGVKKSQSRKTLPGYMLVHMELDDATLHLVRNTPKITGFVGNARKPPPLRDVEVARMRTGVGAAPKPRQKVEYQIGDQIRVTEGPFANFNGSIEEVKSDKQKVKVLVSIFGRSTAVELDFNQIERVG